MSSTIDFAGRMDGGTAFAPPARGLCGKARPASFGVEGLAPAKGRDLLEGLRDKASSLVRTLTGRGGDLEARRSAVLQYVQPALTGLIDGSISTIAPIFAVAFATHSDWKTFLVGMAASVGAGISMGFAEGLSDDGELSGRGSAKVRGLVCGLATAIGGLGHTLPFLLRDFRVATAAACIVVAAELWLIAWIRARFMDTPMGKAMIQIVLGGAITLAVGIAIGSA